MALSTQSKGTLMKHGSVIMVLFVLALFVWQPASAQEGRHSDKGSGTEGTAAAIVKEVDGFHELLHPLVHEAMPNKDAGTIRKGLPALMASAAAIKNAHLPQSMQKKKTAFKNAARKLQAQVEKLNKTKSRLTDLELLEKFGQIHETFELIDNMIR
jgi:hypothetical protein